MGPRGPGFEPRQPDHIELHDTTITIWKPKGPTSHDVVDAVRRATGEQRVGHAGTLDPMAEGILVVGIGRAATRRLREHAGQEKEYVARVHLGATSTTDDAEGRIQASPDMHAQCPVPSAEQISKAQIPTRDDVERVVCTFVGRHPQVPPAYSSVKVRGTPAHRRARRGEALALTPRTVELRSAVVLRYAWPELDLRLTTGPGYYVRALARDLGRTLACGAYLAALTRTRVGRFTRADAIDLADLARR